MFEALGKLFKSNKQSKNLAKSRLHFVLVQDRTGLTNTELAQFKEELITVVEKYFVIDKQGFDIDYMRESETTTLVINSPVLIKRQEVIGKDVGARHESGKKKNKTAPKRQKLEPKAAN